MSGTTTDGQRMTAIDEDRMHAFMGQVVADIGGGMSAPLVVIGEKLGLYRAMAAAGPLSSQEVAERTGTAERYVREWLRNQAAGGYVAYDPARRSLHAPGRARVGARRRGEPVLHARRFRRDRVACTPMRTRSAGVPDRRGHGLARARPPALPRHRAVLPARLPRPSRQRVDPRARGRRRRSSRRARRSPTSAAATAPRPSSWPRRSRTRRSSASTTTTRRSSAPATPPTRPASTTASRFEVAAAKDYPGTDYDLVCVFDCLHDMGDPVGAAAHVHETLAPDGTWMIVEPFAGDRVEDNLNPVGRVFYGASTMICTPGVARPGGRARARRAGRRGTPARGDQARAASATFAAPPRRRST